jgi:peptide/nickel transport system permease protein
MSVETPKPPQGRRRGVGVGLARYLEALRSPKGLVSIILIGILFLIAFLAPVIFPDGFDAQSRDSLLPPSLAHPFGTDELGRDIFARTFFGLRTDLTLVLAAVPLSMILGSMLGLIGYVSDRLGNAVQRALDVIVGFPSLILGISLVLVMGTGWLSIFATIVIVGLPTFGRLARSSLLSQQNREYVLAARTLGIGKWTVMVRHIAPNALDVIIVQAAVFLVHSVFLEAGLSIVGLGIQPPEPSLGTLLNSGIRFIVQSPTYILGPTLVLIVLALAFSLLADSLNERVNRR